MSWTPHAVSARGVLLCPPPAWPRQAGELPWQRASGPLNPRRQLRRCASSEENCQNVQAKWQAFCQPFKQQNTTQTFVQTALTGPLLGHYHHCNRLIATAKAFQIVPERPRAAKETEAQATGPSGAAYEGTRPAESPSHQRRLASNSDKTTSANSVSTT